MGIVGKEIPTGLQEPRKKVTSGRPAVFLDRDGTINEEVDFVCSPEELRLIPGAARAISRLNEAGLVTCVISNQSGVARGLLTEEDLLRIHAKLEHDLQSEGARLDRIYYCPHHPTEGIPPYNISCTCRKPATGMLESGRQEFSIDLRRSFVVGDRLADIGAGTAAGAQTILVQTGYGKNALEDCSRAGIAPDRVLPSLAEAVEYILGENGSHA
jgi:D-glycero-D-manno-heptose 1,7-bisphosphate phosphatase